MRTRRRNFTTREDAFPYSYTWRAEPRDGNVGVSETNAGGLAVAVLSEGSLCWEEESDEVEIYEVGGVCESDREFDMSMLHNTVLCMYNCCTCFCEKL